MRVQFFNPPIFYYSGFHYRMLPTLSLPILAAVLNNAGHYAETVDLEALGVSPEQLTQVFKGQIGKWPDVIGVTSLTITARGAKDTIKALRAAGFTGRIVIGGVHVTLNPQEGLDWGADLVVTGECEGNLVELLESGATGIQAGKRMNIEDLPGPDWTHHNPQPSTYTGNMSILKPHPGISMWTRGCPYACIFCGNKVFGKQSTRYRPPANIETEMADLKKRGCENVFVYDDELIGTKMPPGWMHEIADRVGPMGFKWVTQGRCSQRFITRELLLSTKRAGCRAVFWGVESFSQRVLDAMKKHITEADIWYTLRLAKEVGLENGVFTMIGNYKETEEDLAYSRDALKKAYKEGLLDYRQTTVCTAMPGTELAEIQMRDGTYIEAPTSGAMMQQIYAQTPYLTKERIAYWHKEFYETGPLGTLGEPKP